jgi:hypothetical protein
MLVISRREPFVNDERGNTLDRTAKMMYRGKHMKVFSFLRMSALLGIAALLLGSCASLPLPDTPEKSLLIIGSDISINMPTKGPQLTAITMSLYRVTDYKVFTFPISLTRNLTCVAVEPGQYSIGSIVLTRTWIDGGRQWDSWKENQSVGAHLLVEPQTVLLYPSVLFYKDKPDTNTGYDFRFWNTLPPRQRDEAYKAITKDTHWQAWEGYTLVNFLEE